MFCVLFSIMCINSAKILNPLLTLKIDKIIIQLLLSQMYVFKLTIVCCTLQK